MAFPPFLLRCSLMYVKLNFVRRPFGLPVSAAAEVFALDHSAVSVIYLWKSKFFQNSFFIPTSIYN